ncbi:MAG: DUF2236 domain-containing protein [Saprospiraceae bacterium]|nr:DUF2236 domain-containing protein [Saprospiraceae bacterium]
MHTNQWTNELLDRMRTTGDPLADKAAQALWREQNSRQVVEGLREIARNHRLQLSGFPQEVADYFRETEQIAIHAEDQEKFDLAANLFNNYGFRYCALLFFKALPTGYMCPKPGHVLRSTRLMVDFAARRVMETAQFIFAVNNANWYKPGNPGLEAIQRVRLMHAGMRIALLNDERPDHRWNMQLGIPINQEDLALTNHLFSTAMIDGLDQMGIHLLADEREAVFHTWQHIGQAMGICPELYTADYASGREQYRSIFERQCSMENPDGPALTRALLESLDAMLRSHLPLESLEDITGYFLDDPRARKSLGLHPASIGDRIFDSALHFLTSLRVWQRLFHHRNSFAHGSWLSGMLTSVVARRFGLSAQLSQYPKTGLMSAVSKVLLAELSKRDLHQFEAAGGLNAQKPFFFENSLLYDAWDLGSFALDPGAGEPAPTAGAKV